VTYVPRWKEEDGIMKPLISFVHVIPIEERDLPHCAQLCCWCSPLPDDEDPVIIIHNAMTNSQGYILVGEMTMPAERRYDRAATLLEQLSAPAPVVVPVAVGERPWEREGWCDERGRCWLQGKVEGDWRLLNPTNSGVPQIRYCFAYSLPFHAIPLPQAGEGEV
jgi:hypothetical protein